MAEVDMGIGGEAAAKAGGAAQPDTSSAAAATPVSPARAEPPPSMELDDDEENEAGSDLDKETFGEGASGVSDEQRLARALGAKERGNALLAKGEVEDAIKQYERGLKIVSRVYGDEQASGLKGMLSLNAALACTRLSRYGDAIRHADAALALQPGSAKALYRRGVARAAFGLLDEAKADLTEVLKVDPQNGLARKELASVKDKITQQRRAERASFGGLFAKAGGSIYDDKEEERRRRAAADAERAAAEEREWKQSNEDRAAVGLGMQTQEEWRKERDTAKATEKAEAVADKARERMGLPKPMPKAAKAASSAGGDDSDDHLDEEDLKIIQETKKQGYCYFRRELDEKEKALLEEEQRKLRSAVSQSPTVSAAGGGGGTGDGSSMTDSPAVATGRKMLAGDSVGSEWNAAGTWEETDKTEWARARITALLETACAESGPDLAKDPSALMREMGAAFGEGSAAAKAEAPDLAALATIGARLAHIRAHVYKVEGLEGEASAVVVRGRRRTLFDFSMSLKWRITLDESLGVGDADAPSAPSADASSSAAAAPSSRIKTYKGTMKLTDVTAADAESGAWETPPEVKLGKGVARWPAAYEDRMEAALAALKGDVMAKVQAFYAEYQTQP